MRLAEGSDSVVLDSPCGLQAGQGQDASRIGQGQIQMVKQARETSRRGRNQRGSKEKRKCKEDSARGNATDYMAGQRQGGGGIGQEQQERV